VKILRGRSDDGLKQIRSALNAYVAHHKRARIDIYRLSKFSIRIRVIDPDVTKLDRFDRMIHAWRYLEGLPDAVVGDVISLLVLTPAETKKSWANMEFENPEPSRL
jgi:hypothetical protein